MTKITVLGGSGFLGSHLADFLSKKVIASLFLTFTNRSGENEGKR